MFSIPKSYLILNPTKIGRTSNHAILFSHSDIELFMCLMARFIYIQEWQQYISG